MGQSLSAPQKKFFDELKFLLASNNLAVSDADLKALLLALDTHCPWFPQDGTLDLKDWEKIGHFFHNHPQINVKVLLAWFKVYKAMSCLTPANILLASSPAALPLPSPILCQPLPSSKPPVYVPPKPPDLSPSVPTVLPPPPSAPPPAFSPGVPNVATTPLQESLRAAAPLLAFDSATPNLFPVIVPAAVGGGPARHEQFDLRFIKELYSSVRDNGLHSPYTLGLFGTIFQQNLIPEDVKLLARTVMQPHQMILFIQAWHWACQRRVDGIRNNLNNAAQAAHQAAIAAAGAPPPAPVMLTHTDVFDGLTGGGNFLTIAQQLALDPMYWEATTAAAQEALSAVPDEKTERDGRWGSVRQGPAEPYGQFVDRLYNTLKRQVQDVAAQEVIVRQLAFDNANEDCKQALRPLMTTPNIAIADMLKACQSVGTETHKARLLAAALSSTVSQNPAKDKTCFGCGKMGHFRAQCRSITQQCRPSTKCPICKKGFHWANQCRFAVPRQSQQQQQKQQHQQNQLTGNRQSGPPRAQDLCLPVPYVPQQAQVSTGAGFSSSAQCLVFPLSEVLQQGVHLVPDVLHGLQHNDPYVTVFSDRPTHLPSGSPIAKIVCAPETIQNHDPLVAATFSVTEERPKIQMTLGGRMIEGVLDTGADCSVIASKDWPPAWPTEPASSVVGVGGSASARRSRNPILIQGSQGFEMTILPLILDIPVSLWGAAPAMPRTALSLCWTTDTPVWVDQWPLPKEKLAVAAQLISEQLELGHIEPSTSPWNTPIFVIRKKASGKFRLLQDLRRVNEQMQPMGTLQPGIPNPNMLPQNHQLAVIDLKDCFFSIPLAPQDRQRFAFTLPVLNNSQPTQRFQWVVLPQGMRNSPTLCQYFVDKALQPFRERHPVVTCYHYMDDILLSSSHISDILLEDLTHALMQAGLTVAKEKIQRTLPITYLGHKLSAAAAIPVAPQLQFPDHLKLVDLQQLLGQLNWIKSYLDLPTSTLSPLFSALKGHKDPARLRYVLRTALSPLPLPSALTVFTDGTKSRGVVVWDEEGKWKSLYTTEQSSAQRAELAAVILAFQQFADIPFNLIVDTQYVYNLLNVLPLSYITPAIDDNLFALFSTLQSLVQARTCQFYVAHLRSHTGHPGYLAEGNDRADQALKNGIFSLFSDPFESHSVFHQNAKVLAKSFSLPISQARDIVSQCAVCSKSPTVIPYDAVNPRGLHPLAIWQMDVTYTPSLAPFSKVHLTVDTASGFIWATPLKGETTRHVIQHLMRCFAVMGKPHTLKTDNGPAYISQAFSDFCSLWDVRLTHGIPFNSTGQAIVERSHLTFKTLLNKQLGGRSATVSEIPNIVHQVLFTLNHLLYPHNKDFTPAELHFRKEEVLQRPLVSYRLLPDPQWKGPTSLLSWGRGFAAIDVDGETRWVPARHHDYQLPSVDTVKRRSRRAALLQKARKPELYHQIWTNNTYVRDINNFASILNLSECWVCMHIPPQSKRSGILLHGIPVNASYKISNNMKDNRTSSPPVFLSLVETASHCFHFNRNSSKFLGHYPYCNWTYEYVNGSSCFLNVTTMSGRPKVLVNNVTTNMTYEQQAMCRDFYVWFDWMKKSSKSTCLLRSDLWLFCGTRAYKEIPFAFSGTCTLGIVIPLVYKLDKLPVVRLRNKREVRSPISQYTGTAVSRSLLPSLGAGMNYRDLHKLANWTEALFNSTILALKLINKEMSEMRDVTLENRYALDVILASKGGVCALIHSHCCMYISDQSANISATIDYMEQMIAHNPLNPPEGFDPWEWLSSWLPNRVWLRKILLIVILLVAGFIVLCCCIQCLPSLFAQCSTWWYRPRPTTGVTRGIYIARYQRLGNETNDSD
ncbi:endogenous retrovirus group K member 9 Pol protein-like [Podarcis lilfordi]|uniref:Gag-Pro-Pol polyprotein n=1 Tax=Podarcis lilfordi TaxID=74358 RepID=A0AA35JLZ1_9SAUR|nr:endogenous retrovirus group K member 9 Pol protein-like [Podarcis lilfordi]